MISSSKFYEHIWNVSSTTLFLNTMSKNMKNWNFKESNVHMCIHKMTEYLKRYQELSKIKSDSVTQRDRELNWHSKWNSKKERHKGIFHN